MSTLPDQIPPRALTLSQMALDADESRVANALTGGELWAAQRSGLKPSEYLAARNSLRAAREIS